MSPNETATKEILAPQTSAPQTSTSAILLLNPRGGLKQLADLTLDLNAIVNLATRTAFALGLPPYTLDVL